MIRGTAKTGNKKLESRASIFSILHLANFTCLIFLTIACTLTDSSFSSGTEHKPANLQDKQGYVVKIDTNGIGGISDQTPFTLSALEQAFPFAKVISATRTIEGTAIKIYEIRQDHELLLEVFPAIDGGSVGSILVSSSRVITLLGDRIGSQFRSIYSSNQDCVPGIEEFSGTIWCEAPGARKILYIFRGEWDGPDNLLPPDNILADWVLSQIYWQVDDNAIDKRTGEK